MVDVGGWGWWWGCSWRNFIRHSRKVLLHYQELNLIFPAVMQAINETILIHWSEPLLLAFLEVRNALGSKAYASKKVLTL